MEPQHSVLARQLRRLALDPTRPPGEAQWIEFLSRVDRTYADADQDRYTLERSIEISGAEMRELYVSLSQNYDRLLATRERARAIFEHSVVGQASIDMHGRFTETNQALSSMLGWSAAELTGRALIELIEPASRVQFAPILDQLLAGGSTPPGVEHQWQTKAGGLCWVNVTLSLVRPTGPEPGFAAVLVQDVQERKRLEIELRLAQKLESVGRLASGIAHEINTPVQFVGDNIPFLEGAFAALRELRRGYLELLTRALATGCVSAAEIARLDEEADLAYLEEEVPRAIVQTLDGVHRVATIVRALKDFAHPDRNDRVAANLNRALGSTITVARSELKGVAEVETQFGDIPPVPCYVGDLNQVFLNLLVNAAHAIGDRLERHGERGTIRVSTSHEDEHVVIRIADDGGGIPEELHDRVFEPFFTTKEVGRGTGQGLALARAVVVDRHKGKLSFSSTVGVGTTFEIRLPVEIEP